MFMIGSGEPRVWLLEQPPMRTAPWIVPREPPMDRRSDLATIWDGLDRLEGVRRSGKEWCAGCSFEDICAALAA